MESLLKKISSKTHKCKTIFFNSKTIIIITSLVASLFSLLNDSFLKIEITSVKLPQVLHLALPAKASHYFSKTFFAKNNFPSPKPILSPLPSLPFFP